MRKYYEYIKNSFKELMAYRVEYFVGIVQRFLAIFVQLYLWRALIGQAGQVATDYGVVTMTEMTSYILVSILINTLIGNNVINDINERVRSGQISTDLIKPLNFEMYVFCRMIGRSLFSFLFQLLPVLGISLLFLDIEFPSVINLLLFLVSALNAFVIMFLLAFNLGLLSFWYMSMWQVSLILGNVIQLLSGRWLPLWFFPQALLSVSAFLPFKMLYFVPISIYLGQGSIAEFGQWILIQYIWIVILFAVTRLMWHAAIRKLVFQGG